ncbi:MAG: hypothetical protein N4J56_002305 [Chroococcidiopsis sp. SAG 2025]|uniref:hypothetical protein n=1 Tax=Chroococcidiopsis sp. SAG 2025 TaxID=171389 RepID=UPI0029370ADB|nr:hypothetical protein [Chroococcidiopsis sp. SAG 2025]MDV2992651.1 hypothetical protein [Chroococcidiopsis sp. SAG 2025]
MRGEVKDKGDKGDKEAEGAEGAEGATSKSQVISHKSQLSHAPHPTTPVALTEGDEVRDSATSKSALAPPHPTPFHHAPRTTLFPSLLAPHSSLLTPIPSLQN